MWFCKFIVFVVDSCCFCCRQLLFLLAQGAKNLATPLWVSLKCVVIRAHWYDENTVVYKITNHIYSHTLKQLWYKMFLHNIHMYIHSYSYLVATYERVSYIVLHLASIVRMRMMLEVQTVGVHIVILSSFIGGYQHFRDRMQISLICW